MSEASPFRVHHIGMSAVDGRSIVVKQLREQFSDRDDLVERLCAEGRFLIELSGDHGVLKGYEVIEMPASIVLEHAPGGSLANRLALRAVAPDAAIQLFRAVCTSVTHAHAHGIIHRDIKPSNILFTARNEPRLSDFGIAVRRGAPSTAEDWEDLDVGTLGYAPPELLGYPAAANTETVDIYELGALLHELLLGAPPHMMHGAETEAELKARIVSGATRDLTSRESELSERHRHLLDSALSPDPSERPKSVAELLALL